MQFPIQESLQSFFSISRFGFNLLDVFLFCIFFLYGYQGMATGFVSGLFELFSYVMSFIIGLKFYSVFGSFFVEYFSIPQGFANAIGFLSIAFVSEFILNIVFRIFVQKSRRVFFGNPMRYIVQRNEAYEHLSILDRIAGIAPGVASAFIILAFFLTLVLSMPLSSVLKQVVSESFVGSRLVSATSGFDKYVNQVFGGAIQDTLNFLTIEPEGDEIVNLHFRTTEVEIDEASEQKMFTMLNKERTLRGFNYLAMDEKLREVARNHSKDMFARGYFSHYTPEGLSPFDRLAIANVSYSFAAENLALAPNVNIAMQGFMESKGHRENILAAQARKVGIGAIYGGIYGIMFSQEFSD